MSEARKIDLGIIRGLVRGLARGLVAFFIVCLMFILLQDILIFPALTGSLFVSKDRPAQTLPSGVRGYFLETSDRERIELWAVERSVQLAAGPVAIFFHGNGETVENVYPIQRWLSALGITSYSFDYRGFGRSSGWPSEQGLYLDAKAVWEFVQKQENIAAKDLIVFASSIGSGPGAWLAQEYQVGTLVLMAPFTSLIDVIKGRFFVSILRHFSWYHFPVDEYVAKLKTTCLIVAAGQKDSIIPFELSKEVVARYHGTGNLNTLYSASAGHNNLLLSVQKELSQVITACH